MCKKFTFFLIAFLAIKASHAQTITFENYNGWFDSNGVNYFKGTQGVPGDYDYHEIFGTFTLRNDTSAFGDYWSGWAISRLKDSVSLDYDTNDCAAFPASASSVYATAYQSYDSFYNRIRFDHPLVVMGLSITNSTIAYRSMENGDFVAKKFGGPSGNDPDFYRVIFKGWNNGILKPDSVIFYLADFRDSNNINDYIVNTWEYVDLQTIGMVDSIYYYLESSDNGGFGMNTPAYFCIDNVVNNPEAVSELSMNAGLGIFPNPFAGSINIANKTAETVKYDIFDNTGRRLANGVLEGNQQQLVSTQSWSTGIYFVHMRSGEAAYYYKIVK